jgi:hypothetical protein
MLRIDAGCEAGRESGRFSETGLPFRDGDGGKNNDPPFRVDDDDIGVPPSESSGVLSRIASVGVPTWRGDGFFSFDMTIASAFPCTHSRTHGTRRL